MNKLIYLICIFVLAASSAAAQTDKPTITFEALDVTNAQKERAFKARQKKAYDKYRRVIDPNAIGRFSEEDTQKCQLEKGMVIERYGREACNMRMPDANQTCSRQSDCQGSCLAVTAKNARQHGINPEPTNLRNQPGRCAMYLHIIGCATLVSQKTKCSPENKAVQK